MFIFSPRLRLQLYTDLCRVRWGISEEYGEDLLTSEAANRLCTSSFLAVGIASGFILGAFPFATFLSRCSP